MEEALDICLQNWLYRLEHNQDQNPRHLKQLLRSEDEAPADHPPHHHGGLNKKKRYSTGPPFSIQLFLRPEPEGLSFQECMVLFAQLEKQYCLQRNENQPRDEPWGQQYPKTLAVQQMQKRVFKPTEQTRPVTAQLPRPSAKTTGTSSPRNQKGREQSCQG